MAKHEDLVDGALHVPGYVQDTDPGAVGAGKLWVDTTDPANPVGKIRNAGDTDWDALAGSGGGGAFTLPDPTSGSPGDVVTVNGAGTDYELDTPSGGGGGGGGGFGPIEEAPASPSDDDDEFTTGTLDARWTVIDTPDASLRYTKNKYGTWLALEGGVGSSNDLLIRQTLTATTGGKSLTGTDFQCVFRVALGAWKADSIPIADMTISNNSTYGSGNYMNVGLHNDGSTDMQVTCYDGSEHSGDSIPNAVGAGGVFFCIRRRGSDNRLTIWYSMNGVAWKQAYDPGTWAHDITHFYVRCYLNTRTDRPGSAMHDFIRFNDSRADPIIPS